MLYYLIVNKLEIGDYVHQIKNMISNLYKIIFKVFGAILPKDEHLIIFESFLGKQYSDNPRAIYEYLAEHYPHLKLYWSVDKQNFDSFAQYNVHYAKRFSVKWLFLMTRAKYWVSNSRLPLWIPKPSKTIYLQTWHGTPLKKLATDMDEVHMPGTNTEKYKKNFVTESSKWDYLISPNEYSTEIFKRAFQFNKTMIESGYPRNDFLFTHNNKNNINAIKNKLQLPKDKKIILYAPTWRDDDFKKVGHYKFNLPFDLAEMEKSLGDEYLIILRLHYLIAEKIDLSNYPNFIVDYSYHEDIRDLYLVSDILITDYSSVFFDYANLKRPMIFYVHDIDNYRDKLRGFYFDFETSAPGPLVKTTTDLIQAIKAIEDNDYPLEAYQADFHNFTKLEDGSATKRVVETVFKDI